MNEPPNISWTVGEDGREHLHVKIKNGGWRRLSQIGPLYDQPPAEGRSLFVERWAGLLPYLNNGPAEPEVVEHRVAAVAPDGLVHYDCPMEQGQKPCRCGATALSERTPDGS